MGHHDCALAIGPDFQVTAQLPQSFAHTSNSNSGSTSGGQLNLLFRRHPFASILDFHSNVTVGARDSHLGEFTSRMAMNVRKRFLHHAKDGGFGFLRQTLEIFGEIQYDLDLATLRESLDVPAK